MTTRQVPEPGSRRYRNQQPGQARPVHPKHVVASYGEYAAAERAVDHLSGNGFPIEKVAIVGRGLSAVEQVTGRRKYWIAAVRYAIAGGFVGALTGWLLGLFDLMDPLVASAWLALLGALFGAIAGAAFGPLAHMATGGRRDFSSVGMIRADRYDLQVDALHAREAARLLYADDDDVTGAPTGRPAQRLNAVEKRTR